MFKIMYLNVLFFVCDISNVILGLLPHDPRKGNSRTSDNRETSYNCIILIRSAFYPSFHRCPCDDRSFHIIK